MTLCSTALMGQGNTETEFYRLTEAALRRRRTVGFFSAFLYCLTPVIPLRVYLRVRCCCCSRSSWRWHDCWLSPSLAPLPPPPPPLKSLSHVCFPDLIVAAAAAASGGFKHVFFQESKQLLFVLFYKGRIYLFFFLPSETPQNFATLSHDNKVLVSFNSCWPRIPNATLTGFFFFHFFSLPEPRAADHEKVGPLQHRASALLLLLQRRQGQSAAAPLPRRGRAALSKTCPVAIGEVTGSRSQNGTAETQRWRRGAFI